MPQQSEKTLSIADLITQTLTSMQTAHEDLTQLIEREGGLSALVETARGTALLRDLRQEVNQLNRLLPLKS